MEKGTTRSINAFVTSSVVAILFVAAATIGGELYTPLKDWLAQTFSHHWIGKGVLSFFVLFGGGALLPPFSPNHSGALRAGLWVLTAMTVLAGAAIVGFYLYEAFFAVH